MNRQRGFAGWITLAIYAGLAAVILGGTLFAWNSWVAQPYIEQGRAEERPKTAAALVERDKAQARAKAAEDANVSLQADVKDLQERVANQNAAIRKLQATVAAMKRASASLAEEARAALLAATDEINRNTAIALGPPVADACAVADRIAREIIDYLGGKS